MWFLLFILMNSCEFFLSCFFFIFPYNKLFIMEVINLMFFALFICKSSILAMLTIWGKLQCFIVEFLLIASTTQDMRSICLILTNCHKSNGLHILYLFSKFLTETDVLLVELIGRNHALYFVLTGICVWVLLFICFDDGVVIQNLYLFLRYDIFLT